ncbi:MAG: hypothetical protein AB7F75_12755, partial [Planctomycetota bacterium]
KVIELDVPAGHYNIYAGNVQRGGKKGQDIYIAHIGTGGNRFFDVPEKGEVEIKIGEALHFDADVNFTTNKNGKSVISVTNPQVIGVFDELYFGITPGFTSLELRFLDPSGKLIKSFDWKAKADVSKDGDDILAEDEARRQIEAEIATIRATIADIERNMQQVPPGTPLYLEYETSLAEWNRHLDATIADSNVFFGDATFNFHPITMALDKLPKEYDIEIRGDVFFGKVQPLKIRIKGDKRPESEQESAPPTEPVKP